MQPQWTEKISAKSGQALSVSFHEDNKTDFHSNFFLMRPDSSETFSG